MITFKQFLKESKQLNEAVSVKDLQQAAFDLTSGNGYIDKACKALKIKGEYSWDELYDAVFAIKDKNKLYDFIKNARGIDIRKMNPKQMNDILYGLCFHDEWIEKIADIMIANNIGNVDKDWTESNILIYFEDKPNKKELDLIWKKLNLV